MLVDFESETTDLHPTATIEPRRSQRTRQIPQRLHDYDIFSESTVNSEGDLVHLALFSEIEPVSFEEAMDDPKWIEAMKDELRSIEKNKTWELVSLPLQKKSIDVKWVYKVKEKPKGEVAKYKARLVAKGFLQKAGIDYGDVFAPVARIETVRLVVALASLKGWPMYQLDVKSAFLNGEIEEEVYVAQPPGFKIKGQEEKVYKLRKDLYGLKQAPRAWNKRIDSFLHQMKFIKCTYEHGVYVKSENNSDLLIACLYVDDLLVTGSNQGMVVDFKRSMMEEFEMTDLGHLSYFLGIEFKKTEKGIVMHQCKYATDILKKFNLYDCNPCATPAEIGLLLKKDGPE
uniref:Retrovirus-related Pol polyprotein from transposon TNT 1-94 n=1 Tax=Cajanus cajan TaxID=3821 RepID=A0A151TQM2_CAJCA|nr:Retrovirus-related Pol polyprotein from transposon TNT 1-94 [Cajanus cajan]